MSNERPDQESRPSIGSRIKDFANDYANLIIALATLTLAAITGLYFCEAREMRIQTKRLVDSTIDQFKITSYPTFLIEPQFLLVESNKSTQEFKITNRGEITAFNLAVLIVNAYQKDPPGTLRFVPEVGAYYEGDKKKISLDYERKIPKDSYNKITLEKTSSSQDESIKPLHALLFIRFKVPYDKQYRYETIVYILEKDRFEPMDQNDSKNLIKRYLKVQSRQKVKDFLADYQPQ